MNLKQVAGALRASNGGVPHAGSRHALRLAGVVLALGVVLMAPTAASDALGSAPNTREPASLISAPPEDRDVPPGPPTMPALIPLLKSGLIPAGELDSWRYRSADEIGRLFAAPAYRNTPCEEPSSLYHPQAPDSIDVLHYDIHYRDIDEGSHTVEVTTRIRLKALRPLTAVDLNLAGFLVESVRARRSSDSEFVSATYDLGDGNFHVGPIPPVEAGDTVEILVDLLGIDPSCISLFGIPSGIIFSSFGAHTFGEPSGARHWFPCHDVPWDKATATLTIDVEGDRDVSATGVLVEDDRVDGKRRRVWAVEEPAATYLLAFYLGDFVRLEDSAPNGVPLEYFVYPDLVDKAKVDFANLPEMMEFYSTLHPYPFGRYAMTLGFFPGGMEHQTNSLIGWTMIRGTRVNEDVFAHELAHQWWGDLVTPATWSDIWLNEGFATYFDLLFTEHRYGWPALQRRMAVLDSVYKAHPDLDHRVGDPPQDRVLSFVVYNKGAHILHMLRGISRMRLMTGPPAPPESFTSAALEGDRRFLRIFSRYAREHAYGNVSTAHFQAAAEAELGEDLTWFFLPWLYGTGYIRVGYDWRAQPFPGGTSMSVRLKQDPTAETRFRMPIHVRYTSGERFLDEVRFLDGESLAWSVDLPAGDWTVTIDPDGWLLMDVERRSLFTALAALTVAPNPSPEGFLFTGNLDGPEPVPGRLLIHDIQGRLVVDRDLGSLIPGPVEVRWDGIAGGRRVAAGVYLARLRLGSAAAVKRLVVLPGP